MNAKQLGIILVSIVVLAGCGGSSGSSSTTKPLASITINATNADSVSKGAVSSQSVADSGATSANGIKSASIVGDSSQKYSALSLALSHLKMAESLPLSSGSTRAVAGWPSTLDCAQLPSLVQTTNTSNIVTYSITDADNSTTISVGDTINVAYTSCMIPNTTVTINGGTSLTFNAYNNTTSPSPSNPNTGSITLGYSSFTVANSGPPVSIGFNGSMTMAYTYNGTLLSASMTGSSFTASNSLVGSVTYTNFNLTSTANATEFTFYADMSISMIPTGSATAGVINVSTPTTFRGPLGGNPTSGQMRIDGAGGSYITITAGASNVSIIVFDGSTTVVSVTKPWDQI